MYYSITGKALVKEGYAVVFAGGIGYRVYTSLSTLGRIKNNDECTLYTYLSVKEDSLTLFGFDTEEELSTFRLLISVSGVGPKAGIAILSALTPAEFAMSIVTQDAKSITKAHGVGKKMAEKIIVELKDKLKGADLTELTQSPDIIVNNSENYIAEAVNALMVLGYSAADSRRVVESVSKEADNLEDIIKAALKKLAVM